MASTAASTASRNCRSTLTNVFFKQRLYMQALLFYIKKDLALGKKQTPGLFYSILHQAPIKMLPGESAALQPFPAG